MSQLDAVTLPFIGRRPPIRCEAYRYPINVKMAVTGRHQKLRPFRPEHVETFFNFRPKIKVAESGRQSARSNGGHSIQLQFISRIFSR